MLEAELVKERKKASLPTVIASGEPQLFSVEDLKTAEAQRKIDGATPYSGKGTSLFQPSKFSSGRGMKVFCPGVSGVPTSCLLPPPGKGAKFRRFNGYAPGKGKGTFFAAGYGANRWSIKGGKSGRGKESAGVVSGKGVTVPLISTCGAATVLSTQPAAPKNSICVNASSGQKGDALPAGLQQLARPTGGLRSRSSSPLFRKPSQVGFGSVSPCSGKGISLVGQPPFSSS